jgi:hypothetical protein
MAKSLGDGKNEDNVAAARPPADFDAKWETTDQAGKKTGRGPRIAAPHAARFDITN